MKIKPIVALVTIFMTATICSAQNGVDSMYYGGKSGYVSTGFMYVKGVQWIENEKQDSIKNIVIEGDTMAAIRSLLVYCLQEKSENDYANLLLSQINLDYLKTMFKSKEFTYCLKEYRKVIAKNKKQRTKDFPTYKPYKPTKR